jgi:AcrR family transcriptional regulator
MRRSYEMRSRADSTQATRDRIVGAMLDLFLERWYDEISLKEVANSAGVALQTVVNHFSTKEGLLAALLEDPRLLAQFAGHRFRARAGEPARALELLVADYERAGDAMVRMLALEGRVPAIRPVLEIGRVGHRDWLASIFSSELAPLPDRDRGRRLDLLVCATDVYVWQILRRDQHRSRKQTVEAMLDMVEAINATGAGAKSAGRRA